MIKHVPSRYMQSKSEKSTLKPSKNPEKIQPCFSKQSKVSVEKPAIQLKKDSIQFNKDSIQLKKYYSEPEKKSTNNNLQELMTRLMQFTLLNHRLEKNIQNLKQEIQVISFT